MAWLAVSSRNPFVSPAGLNYSPRAEFGPSDAADPIEEGVIDMHELSIMQNTLDLALAQAQQARANRVHALRLRVGTLSGVVPDALQFAFEILTRGTLAEGAQLAIESVLARFWCAICASEFEAEDMIAQCPGCGSFSSELRAGRELELTSLEIT